MNNPFLLGFSALVISALLWPAIPTAPVGAVLLLLAVLLYRVLPMLAGAFMGIGWVVFFTLMTFDYRLMPEGRDQWVRAEIITPVSVSGDWQSIDIQLVKPKLISLPAPKIRLDWRTNIQVEPGEVWEFRLARRSISGPLNQGGFNSQRYLLSRHIGLKARVLEARLVSSSSSIRTRIITTINQSLAGQTASPVLLALLTGEQRQISASTWQQLRATGTGHLLSISGLHLSVVALWLYVLLKWALIRLWPRQDRLHLMLASVVALLGCLLYALLAGMSIPTQRAFVMLALVSVLTLSRRFGSPWERLLYALALVLLLDPLAPLAAGFWLSFGAMSMIFLSLASETISVKPASFGARVKRQAMALLKVQLYLSVGMGALQLMLFGGVSVHSVWMNLLMVPWFSFVVIPLALLSLLLFLLLDLIGVAAAWVFKPALLSLYPFELLLELSDSLPASWVPVTDALAFPLLFMLLALGLFLLPESKLPFGRWLRLLPITLCLPLFAYAMGRNTDDWQVHMLDVGQGLSVVVTQGAHTLVYDTGAAFGEGFSYGERVVVPFLQAQGRQSVEVLVISHEDNDHAGGAKALLAAMPVGLMVSDTHEAALRLQHQPYNSELNTGVKALMPCLTSSLTLGELSVRVLPAKSAQIGERVGNNASCVVHVSDGKHSLLLTGDIEFDAEQALLSSGVTLGADILTAPHHGSKTSSSKAFIDAVSPRFTLFAAGLNNRYGFPKADVSARYQQSGATLAQSGTMGQLSLLVSDEIQLVSYREQRAPFWYNQVFGVGDWPITE